MKYIYSIITVLLLAGQVCGAAFTSKATGNWSASGQTTWNEAGVPGTGDTVTIANGHTVTVDASTSVAATVVEGGLTLGAYTLTMGGNLTIGNGASKDGTLTFGAGSTLALGANNLVLNNATLVDTTTSGGWATVTGSGSIVTGAVYTSPKTAVVLQYVSFQNTATVQFELGNGGGITSNLDLDNCVFDGPSYILIGRGGYTAAATNRSINACDFRNPTSLANNRWMYFAGLSPSTGTAAFTHNTAYSATHANILVTTSGWTVSGNTLIGARWGGADSVLVSSAGGFTVSENYFALPDTASTTNNHVCGSNGAATPSSLADNYFYGANSNPHFFTHHGVYTNTDEMVASGNVIEVVYNTDGANWIAYRGGTLTVRNNLLIGSGNIVYGTVAVTGVVTNVDHNTVLVKENDAESYGYVWNAETSGDYAGDINVRSNIVTHASGVSAGGSSRGCADISTNQPTTFALGDYNDWNGMDSDYYQISVTGRSTHDIDAAPLFVDETRCISTWTAGGGIVSPSAANAKTYLLAINGYNSTAKTQSDTPSTQGPDDLVKWVRAGYAPTNSALKDAGHDSVTIGAVEGVFSNVLKAHHGMMAM